MVCMWRAARTLCSGRGSLCRHLLCQHLSKQVQVAGATGIGRWGNLCCPLPPAQASTMDPGGCSAPPATQLACRELHSRYACQMTITSRLIICTSAVVPLALQIHTPRPLHLQ